MKPFDMDPLVAASAQDLRQRLEYARIARAEAERKLANERKKYDTDKIIFNPPATVVIWKDGTKTIVKCGEDEVFDHEVGVAMCFMKKIFGSRSAFKRTVKEYLPKEPKNEPKNEPKKEPKRGTSMSPEEWSKHWDAMVKQLRRSLYGGEPCSEK